MPYPDAKLRSIFCSVATNASAGTMQGPFHDLPERFVLFVQQEHQPRRLRVEGRRDVSYRKMNDFLDLCVVDRGFGGQFIITAPVLQRVFQISLHSR